MEQDFQTFREVRGRAGIRIPVPALEEPGLSRQHRDIARWAWQAGEVQRDRKDPRWINHTNLAVVPSDGSGQAQVSLLPPGFGMKPGEALLRKKANFPGGKSLACSSRLFALGEELPEADMLPGLPLEFATALLQ